MEICLCLGEQKYVVTSRSTTRMKVWYGIWSLMSHQHYQAMSVTWIIQVRNRTTRTQCPTLFECSARVFKSASNIESKDTTPHLYSHQLWAWREEVTCSWWNRYREWDSNSQPWSCMPSTVSYTGSPCLSCVKLYPSSYDNYKCSFTNKVSSVRGCPGDHAYISQFKTRKEEISTEFELQLC